MVTASRFVLRNIWRQRPASPSAPRWGNIIGSSLQAFPLLRPEIIAPLASKKNSQVSPLLLHNPIKKKNSQSLESVSWYSFPQPMTISGYFFSFLYAPRENSGIRKAVESSTWIEDVSPQPYIYNYEKTSISFWGCWEKQVRWCMREGL